MSYLALIPTIVQLIQAVEALMPASSGRDKLDAVVASVENITGVVTENLPALQKLVGVFVAAFNLRGIFTKKPT